MFDISGGVRHRGVSLHHAGRPADQRVDAARSLAGRSLLPVSRSFSPGRRYGETYGCVLCLFEVKVVIDQSSLS